MNDQLKGQLTLLFGLSGPVAALIMNKTGLSSEEYQIWFNALLPALTMGLAASLQWWRDRKASRIKSVLAMPEIATVVVKDTANGKVSEMANSHAPELKNIVTASQNERDAKGLT